ncbi:MAG: CpaF family protein [bacterium]|nr:CpaF family protein [bacterium]
MSLLKQLEEVKKGTPHIEREKTPLQGLKIKVHERLVKELDEDLLKDEDEAKKRAVLKEQVERFVVSTSLEDQISYTKKEYEKLVKEIVDEILGLGPIEPLIQDPFITEIMVNGPKQVYIEKGGKLELTEIRFKDDNHILSIIERIVSPLGRRIDESSPYVDARLKDGSRVNAIIPPLALNGPVLTIRKFFKEPLKIHDLIRFGTMTMELAEFLSACVRCRLNIIVSGGTGSGKTTTLNVLSSFIPNSERIITIEDAAELQLQQEHVVRLETRPPNIEGKGEVTTRDLVRNALRMRPDRIIVGEVRGGEALDMLQAMNTGHDGSLTTVHANSSRDALSRIETMVLMAGMELPIRAIKEQIVSAMDLIIHQSRFQDGSRKIVNVTEIQGMEGDTITLQDIFTFRQRGIDEKGRVLGELKPTGIKPRFSDRFKERGIEISRDLYQLY